MDDVYSKAADEICSADVLLFHLGAGMSADSGLSVFVDIANYPCYEEKKLSYVDLSTAEWLDKGEAGVFFGFWGTSCNNYRNATPHEGYDILRRWKEGAQLSFVKTSNIDTFVIRSGLGTEEDTHELHGDVETWQCSRSCTRKLWRMPPDYRFDVDTSSMRLIPKADDYVASTFEVKQSTLDATCFQDAAFSVASFSGALPTCPLCSAYARPSVLMFNADDTKKWIRRQCSEDNLEHFESVTLPKFLRREPRKVVVVEIGCGVNVPSLRFASERVLRTIAQEHRSSSATLIRINPDHPTCESDSKLIPMVVPIRERALKALQEIDARIEEKKMAFL